LASQRFDALFLRDEVDVNLGWGRSRLPAFARLALFAWVAAAETRSAAARSLTERSRAAFASRRAAAFPVRAVPIPAVTGRAVASGRTGAAAVPAASAVKPVLASLVVGVLGRGRLLRPSGEKELLQIQFVIR
jgi:hypothetical protein